ncbi:MAG: hypothetical protein ACD_87C00220G0001 [uncultured bacterium]|nr:MAG: hypothetical protein ACD_87C00220G0001 [uncultured bacterium]
MSLEVIDFYHRNKGCLLDCTGNRPSAEWNGVPGQSEFPLPLAGEDCLYSGRAYAPRDAESAWIAAMDGLNKRDKEVPMNNKPNEEITRVVYELFEKSGRQEGNDLVNWLAAEKIVHFQQMISGGISGGAISLLEYRPMFDAKTARPAKSKPRSIRAKKEGTRRKSGPVYKQLQGC